MNETLTLTLILTLTLTLNLIRTLILILTLTLTLNLILTLILTSTLILNLTLTLVLILTVTLTLNLTLTLVLILTVTLTLNLTLTLALNLILIISLILTVSAFRPSVRPGRQSRGSNPNRRIPADLRADSLSTVPPTPLRPPLEQESYSRFKIKPATKTMSADLRPRARSKATVSPTHLPPRTPQCKSGLTHQF
ncbi:hypothetical protein PoB_005639700 [Plakobranchus ocellatus]|uniref:Uncharacterized protein n=1 Tax=Plakobranchus ocellatus TaxID=259542 RepID=A0AAV4CEB6_9GAST|nr:hypothetical protein PoB_005639700 [Plakobranchus ocellatus]